MKFSILSLSFLAASLFSTANCTNDVVKPKTVVFPITLTWAKGAPDGFERDMILTNGQFPGPQLDIDEGDNVEFVVHNLLPFPTSVHFHGIEQIKTPWSDGVPGLSQVSIQPGTTFVYRWKATQYGTYWYHGHYRGQLEDGLFGAISIKPAQGTDAPFTPTITNDTKEWHELHRAMEHPEIVLLSDWSHFSSETLHDVSIAANLDTFCGDSILINGKGSVNCPGVPFLMSLVPPPILALLQGQNLTDKGCLAATNTLAQTTQAHNFSAVPAGLFEGCKATTAPLAVIEVRARDKWASLNFVSTASLQSLAVSIDDHEMWLYAIDGRFVEPQLVDAMSLSHGSRHSVMIKLDKPARDYTIRLASDGLNQKVYTSATLSYKGGSGTNIQHPSIDYGAGPASPSVRFLNDQTVVPFPLVPIAKVADQTHKLLLNRTGPVWQWSLDDNQPFGIELEDMTPLLWEPKGLTNNALSFSTKNNTWVDLIFVVTNTAGLQPPHPIHKHSNKAHIIGYGTGEFIYADVAEAMKSIPQNFNLVNPPYRDGALTLPIQGPSTWMVIRYKSENPGAFLLHCHINPHLTGGMAVAILDGIDTFPVVPKEYGPGGHGGTVTPS